MTAALCPLRSDPIKSIQGFAFLRPKEDFEIGAASFCNVDSSLWQQQQRGVRKRERDDLRDGNT